MHDSWLLLVRISCSVPLVIFNLLLNFLQLIDATWVNLQNCKDKNSVPPISKKTHPQGNESFLHSQNDSGLEILSRNNLPVFIVCGDRKLFAGCTASHDFQLLQLVLFAGQELALYDTAWSEGSWLYLLLILMAAGLIWTTELYHLIQDTTSHHTHSMAHQIAKTMRKWQAELEV